jgi:membrane protein YdbS with pleckstrin-like domain
MREAFAPPGEPWTGVSVQLRRMRRAFVAVLAALAAIGLAAAGLAADAPLIYVIGVPCVAALAALVASVVGRNYRSWGYCERAEDLLVTRGVMFRRLVVVPYGRMQLVDVTAGPIERRFGIATVRLHTAAAGTDARIRGLSPDEAARLRDRLAALGEARSAGL